MIFLTHETYFNIFAWFDLIGANACLQLECVLVLFVALDQVAGQ